MANPQKENGYTAIANEIMEALARTRISGEARQMLDVVIRKTYGFNKREDQISTSQFMDLTKLSRIAVAKGRKKLKEMNIITVSKKGYILSYALQKDHTKWQTVSKKGYCIQKEIQVYPKKDTKCIPKGSIQKTKDNITKEIKQGLTPAEAALKDIYENHGVNVYEILNKFKKILKDGKSLMLGPDYRIPDEVILKTCEGFKKYEVKKPYPWFMKVFCKELETWWVNKQDKDHELMKTDFASCRGGDVQSVRDVLGKMLSQSKRRK
jgi:phage replication O-like protein O